MHTYFPSNKSKNIYLYDEEGILVHKPTAKLPIQKKCKRRSCRKPFLAKWDYLYDTYRSYCSTVCKMKASKRNGDKWWLNVV